MVKIYICVGSSCHLKGSYQIIKAFEELIRKHGLESEAELKASFCLGRCTRGVSVKVGEEFIDGLTICNAAEKFDEYVLCKLKK